MKHDNRHHNNRDRKYGKDKFGHNKNGSPFKHNKKRGHRPWNGPWKGYNVNGNSSNSDSGSPKKYHQHQNGIQHHKTHHSLNGKPSHAKVNGYENNGNDRTFESNRSHKPFFSNKNKVHREASSGSQGRENHSVASPVVQKGVSSVEKRKDEIVNGNSNSGSPKKKLRVSSTSDEPVVDEINTDKNALPVMAARKW